MAKLNELPIQLSYVSFILSANVLELRLLNCSCSMFKDVIPSFIGIGLMVSFSVLVHHTRKFYVIVVLDEGGHGSALHFCLGIAEENQYDLHGICYICNPIIS